MKRHWDMRVSETIGAHFGSVLLHFGGFEVKIWPELYHVKPQARRFFNHMRIE